SSQPVVPFVFTLVAVALAWPALSRAESDFEFGESLLNRRNIPSGFGTDDLIERLIGKLDTDPAKKWDGQLLKAEFKRRQAVGASAEKRQKLLDEADAIYKDFL